MKYQSKQRALQRTKKRIDTTQAQTVKLPWYAGASDHFGEVKSQYYAKQFFS